MILSGERNRFVRRRLVAIGILVTVIAAGILVLRDCRTGATSPDPTVRSLAIYSKLSFHQRAGQRVIGGFTGRTVPAGLRRAIRSGRIGGIVLFSQNLGSRAQIRRLTRTLQRIPRPKGLGNAPLLIAVDQEGGLVKRLAGAPQLSAAEMGSRGAAVARRQGRKTGRNLANAGFNVDFAPVLDVARKDGVIDRTRRAFGRSPKRVGRTGVAFADGLRATGVAATAKHFPGLGAAGLNTDDAVQTIHLSKRRLRRVDLKPFRRFIASGGEMIMVGTAIYPPFGSRPAAFNRRLATTELRERLGFRGVTVTDALEATAARAVGGPAKTAVVAARAGIDLMLYGDWREALKGEVALARKLRAGKLKPSEFRDSVERIVVLRRR